MLNTLFSIDNATVRFLTNVLFNDLTFKINKGEHWALIGESGSGKSALLQTIAGRFNITGGTVNYYFQQDIAGLPLAGDGQSLNTKLIALVEPRHHFRNLSNTTDFYYQQRYNSSDSEDALTVDDYLSSVKASRARVPAGHWIRSLPCSTCTRFVINSS
jgi:molybdate transport system ATP-binding protein